ncbi:MAG: FtsQ-type POTRA domain-containing protein [Cellvibrionaceae bacterium]
MAKSATTKASQKHRREKTESRQWNGAFLIISLVLLASGIFYGVQWVDGPVQRVAVNGSFKYLDKRQLEETISHNLSESFLGLDLADMKVNIEAMPWVYRATVRRAWPYTLQVGIEEESPISRWNDAAFVNQGGEVIFIEENNELANLPALEGEDEFAADILDLYRDVAGLAAAKELIVNRLKQDSVGSITVNFSDGSRVLLGRHEKLVRLQRFLKIYSEEKIAGLTFDARYSNGVAVAKNVEIEQSKQQLALQ